MPFRWRRRPAQWRRGAGRRRQVPAAQLPLIESIPMGFVAWAPKRGAIWAGWIPGDGQLVSRATFPDLAAAVADGCSGRVRGRVAGGSAQAGLHAGDGTPVFACRTTTASPQARLARPFSGDGVVRGEWRDQGQPEQGSWSHVSISPVSGGNGWLLPGLLDEYACFLRYVRRGPEAHPSFISGCFVIKAFGAVSRPGSVDAAQLASRLAVLEAALQTDIDFKLLYPGGSATTPDHLSEHAQTIDNPFQDLRSRSWSSMS